MVSSLFSCQLSGHPVSTSVSSLGPGFVLYLELFFSSTAGRHIYEPCISVKAFKGGYKL